MKSVLSEFDEVKNWLSNATSIYDLKVEQCSLTQCKDWSFDKSRGIIVHSTGGFFSVRGIEVIKKIKTDTFIWQQPIIDQSEVGILGLVTRQMDGILYFLIQAKSEPGNNPHTQLAPTLQATKSNYSRVHGGQEPQYLSLFNNLRLEDNIIDQIQTEQGARFLRKRNRNVVIEINDELKHESRFFKWISIDLLYQLAKNTTLLNMDLRSVLASIRMNLLTKNKNVDLSNGVLGKHLDNLSKVTKAISQARGEISGRIYDRSLKKIKDWEFTDRSIEHREMKYFSVIFLMCQINNRERNTWCQPIIKPVGQGLCAIFVRKRNRAVEFLMQLKFECGVDGFMQLAPTIQCLSIPYRSGSIEEITFLKDAIKAEQKEVIYDNALSEEGGRFFHENNRYMILEKDIDFAISPPNDFIWIGHDVLLYFLMVGNIINMQARTLLSVLPLRYED